MVWTLDRGQDGEQTKQPQTQSQERAENLTRTQLRTQRTQRIGKEWLERSVCLSGGGDEHVECAAGVEEATGRSPSHCPAHPGK